jgi:hypothetical protein
VTLTEIIAKLEAATEGSERLDLDIARALGFRIAASTGGPHIMHKNDNVASWDLPRYTRSLDAALKIAPEGWTVQMHSMNVEGAMVHEAAVDYRGWHSAQSLPLAVCIAALKARSVA